MNKTHVICLFLVLTSVFLLNSDMIGTEGTSIDVSPDNYLEKGFVEKISMRGEAHRHFYNEKTDEWFFMSDTLLYAENVLERTSWLTSTEYTQAINDGKIELNSSEIGGGGASIIDPPVNSVDIDDLYRYSTTWITNNVEFYVGSVSGTLRSIYIAFDTGIEEEILTISSPLFQLYCTYSSFDTSTEGANMYVYNIGGDGDSNTAHETSTSASLGTYDYETLVYSANIGSGAYKTADATKVDNLLETWIANRNNDESYLSFLLTSNSAESGDYYKFYDSQYSGTNYDPKISFTYTINAPTVEITSPSPTTYYNNETITCAFDTTGTITTTTKYMDDEIFTNSSFENMAGGQHNFTVYVANIDGSDTDTVLFTVIDLTPSVDITSPLSSGTYWNNDTITCSFTAQYNDTTTKYMDDEIFTNSSFENMVAGQHNFTVVVSNDLGSDTDTEIFTVNDYTPSVDITSPLGVDTYWNNDTIICSFTAQYNDTTTKYMDDEIFTNSSFENMVAGQHNFTVVVSNDLGSDTDTEIFTVNNMTVSVEITSPLIDLFWNNETITMSYDTNGKEDTLIKYMDGQVFTNSSFENMLVGYHNFTVVATNAMSADSDTVIFYVKPTNFVYMGDFEEDMTVILRDYWIALESWCQVLIGYSGDCSLGVGYTINEPYNVNHSAYRTNDANYIHGHNITYLEFYAKTNSGTETLNFTIAFMNGSMYEYKYEVNITWVKFSFTDFIDEIDYIQFVNPNDEETNLICVDAVLAYES